MLPESVPASSGAEGIGLERRVPAQRGSISQACQLSERNEERGAVVADLGLVECRHRSDEGLAVRRH